jgi:hypothetical protein
MIKHIVFFNLVDEAEGKSKLELAQNIKSDLENLKSLIPQIIKIEVGINVPNLPNTNWDISLYSEFENLEDLDIYQAHPAHKEVAGFIGKVKTDRAAVDYEV